MDLNDNDQPMTLSHAIATRRSAKPSEAVEESLDLVRKEIKDLLSEPWRKEFTNTTNNLMRLGNKKPKLVEPRRQKLRDIIAKNVHIAKLYNRYAAKHAESEKRLTYRLPIFTDLEQHDLSGGDDGEKQEELKENQTVSDIKIRPDFAKEANGEERVVEQTEEANDREMEIDQANRPIVGSQSIERDNNKNGREGDAEMMSINALPRTKAPTAQRRHVHFAPKVTKSQEQAMSTFKQVKKTDTVVTTDTPKTAPRAALSLRQPLQSVQPGSTHVQITPVTNPEAFPIKRVQVVQSQYYPYAKIVNMFTHRDPHGEVIRVAADMQDGPLNHSTIHDGHIITALGLRNGDGDKIQVQENAFKMHETFIIIVSPGQRVKNLNNFIVGELRSARHAYLHWLDYRGCTDPERPPFAQEARAIAVQLGRRAHDVWREIDSFWQLEQGNGGKLYRKNRLKYLGEDVRYEVNIERKKGMRSMWG